ncbi:MAG: ferritin-like domain-containing protein [Polyangiaceae bacterium]
MGFVIDLREPARAKLPVVPKDAHLKEAGIGTWFGRMINEFRSGDVFEALAAQLDDAGFSKAEVDECRGFAAEERRHGVLCGSVVEALGGKAYAEVEVPRALPEHADVSRQEAVLRNLLSVSCLSETVAVALIGAERLEMPEGELRDLLTGIWADEVGHARFGWGIVARVVPTLDDATRARLERYLAVAFAHVESHELSHLPASFEPPPGGEALGLCSGNEGRSIFFETITDVIVPRLESLGLRAKDAWERRPRNAFAA